MSLFDEPGTWGPDYHECCFCRSWHPAPDMLGPATCLNCGIREMT